MRKEIENTENRDLFHNILGMERKVTEVSDEEYDEYYKRYTDLNPEVRLFKRSEMKYPILKIGNRLFFLVGLDEKLLEIPPKRVILSWDKEYNRYLIHPDTFSDNNEY